KGVPARRMKVYNELLYNNVEGFLLACFPVCRAILGQGKWTRLAREFFREHRSHTPYFRQIPDEFLKYLQDTWQRPDDVPEFLPELAHYEWVELELATSNRDEGLPAYDAAGDLLSGHPLLNPVLRVLAYRYPVHRLGPRHKPKTAPQAPTFLLAYRTPEFEVRFSLINAATARLVELLQEDAGLSGKAALERLAAEWGQADSATMIETGRRTLADLQTMGALLGTRRHKIFTKTS
ncbi:MAG: putative DNA-binding domain-containing protein, partial [Hydrogenophilaceae bacterium]|nr:putative DNA-binding domain-containing protein [Hydrogenophilaceae bacterium]